MIWLYGSQNELSGIESQERSVLSDLDSNETDFIGSTLCQLNHLPVHTERLSKLLGSHT